MPSPPPFPAPPPDRAPPPGAGGETCAFPLSSGQRRLWFLDQLQPGRPLYNVPIAVRLTGGPVEPAPLRQALNDLVRRHEVLRTRFATRGDEPVQVVEPSLEVPLSVLDLRSLPVEAREPQACRAAREEAQRPFDLRHLPLLRLLLARLGDTEQILVLTVHHIVFDGWSLPVFFRELAAACAARSAGGEPPGETLPVQYADFAVWQRERLKSLRPSLAWWRQRLQDCPPPLELPADRPRPELPAFRGAVESQPVPAGLHPAVETLARAEGATPFMVVLAAFQALLSRYTGQEDVVVGSPVAGRVRQETEGLIGLFINTLVLRGDLSGDPSFRELVRRTRRRVLDALAHEETPFDELVARLHPARSASKAPLFEIMFCYEQSPLESVSWPGCELHQLELDTRTAKFDLTLTYVESRAGHLLRAEYDSDLFEPATIRRLLGHLATFLAGAIADPEGRVSTLPMLAEPERHRLLVEWNDTAADYPREATIPGLFSQQAARTPDAVAAVFAEDRLTYRELDELSDSLAVHLSTLGSRPGALVGVCLDRSLDLVVGLLAILKSGAAYLPLDPHFPPQRLRYLVQDSGARLVLTQQRHLTLLDAPGAQIVNIDAWDSQPPFGAPPPGREAGPRPADPAYVLYTSGSTGQPKGVVVRHRNVVNFFTGMDLSLGHTPGSPPGCWLAVTTISFDISVLELLWTLTRGFRVIIHPDAGLGVRSAEDAVPLHARPLDFSLFYFATDDDRDDGDRYRLLREGAMFADRNGFSAVWTPERHFHHFGGPFPNPAVTSAALAVLTERIQLRAGSVVLPLHNPIRVAEEWAVVDNLSRGRVAIAVASGWHDADFALAPQAYAGRKDGAFAGLEIVRRLWRGGTVRTPGPHGEVEVGIRPRPVQPELPVWITAAGSPDTFRRAGALGANVLTHLLGQNLEELAGKIAAYRDARRAGGHDPAAGTVTLMLHTFIGPDLAAVREHVRAPLCRYLKSSLTLVRSLARRLQPDLATEDLSEADCATLIDSAFDRYFASSGLFGTPEGCLRTLDRLQALGVDEVACLIDFGVETDVVLDSLAHLARLRELHRQRRTPAPSRSPSLAEQIVRHGVTHLQCTPSLASALAAEPHTLAALGRLQMLLLGGEALPAPLAAQLSRALPGRLLNMYGPTETTVWSATHRVAPGAGPVPIGRPIANTRIYILDRHLQPVPVGLAGELYIGGESVAAGYLNRPELTGERFVADPFDRRPDARLYRTGDLARYRPDGEIEFLGRVDDQVKIRGHRIEPAEIEAALRAATGAAEAVVVARDEPDGGRQLVAYVVAPPPLPAAADLRRDLAARLPAHLVPAAFVFLDRLPLTPNGKIDRRALPDPAATRPAARGGTGAVRDGLERQIAAIWEEVLHVKNPGADDNFFDLGGHSLRVAQVQVRLRERLGVDLPLLAQFQHPTIRSLAERIQEKHPDRSFHDRIEQRAQRQRAAARRRPPPRAPAR